MNITRCYSDSYLKVYNAFETEESEGYDPSFSNETDYIIPVSEDTPIDNANTSTPEANKD